MESTIQLKSVQDGASRLLIEYYTGVKKEAESVIKFADEQLKNLTGRPIPTANPMQESTESKPKKETWATKISRALDGKRLTMKQICEAIPNGMESYSSISGTLSQNAHLFAKEPSGNGDYVYWLKDDLF